MMLDVTAQCRGVRGRDVHVRPGERQEPADRLGAGEDGALREMLQERLCVQLCDLAAQAEAATARLLGLTGISGAMPADTSPQTPVDPPA